MPVHRWAMGYDAKLDQAANVVNDPAAFADPELIDVDAEPAPAPQATAPPSADSTELPSAPTE